MSEHPSASAGVKLLPFRRLRREDAKKPVWVGGFSNTDDIQKFGLVRGRSVFGEPTHRNPYRTSAKLYLDKAYYGGILFPFYGHFLLESLATAPNVPDDGIPVVYHTLSGNYKSWFGDVLQLTGLAQRAVAIRREEMIVAELHSLKQENLINNFVSDKFLSWARGSVRLTPSAHIVDRLYISRKFCLNARMCNEDVLETYLIKNGFKVLYPEKTPFEEQVKMIRASKRVVAVEGSAIHSLIFANQPLWVTVIARRRVVGKNIMLQLSAQKNIRFNVFYGCSVYADDFKSPSVLDVDNISGVLES